MNFNPGRLFDQQPSKMGSRGSLKLLRCHLSPGGDMYHTARQNWT